MSRAVVRVGSRVLGVGTVEAKLPPGDNEIVVEADDYNTYTKTVTLTPGETKELAVRLEFSGAAPESPLAELDERTSVKKKKSGSSGGTIFSRPALYTTVLGLAAVGAGVAMGLPLQQRRLKIDRQGVVDITRPEYDSMRQQALLSTALMAGGGAVAAGSWPGSSSCRSTPRRRLPQWPVGRAARGAVRWPFISCLVGASDHEVDFFSRVRARVRPGDGRGGLGVLGAGASGQHHLQLCLG
ncbi:PEGA domain-containing protein [Cystobacter fuscus]